LNTTKGVICKIAEPEEMPVDEAGNRADVVMDGYATVNRMNTGRSYEQYFNSASRDTSKNLRGMLGLFEKTPHIKNAVENIYYENRPLFESAYKYLMDYYAILSPRMYKWLTQDVNEEQRIEHIASIVKDGIYLYLPTDNEVEYSKAISEIEKKYKPTYGPVTYIGNSGNKVTTKDPVRIGSVYFMLLEKTGDDWAAVASAKLQHFGIISTITRSDKHSSPVRNQPVRAIGESEGRIFASYAGQAAIAEMMDRNNNPQTHKSIVESILTAPVPTNIPKVTDRKKIPYGGSKPLAIVNHVLQCAGIKFVYHKTK
jgi:hypothetical protein